MKIKKIIRLFNLLKSISIISNIETNNLINRLLQINTIDVITANNAITKFKLSFRPEGLEIFHDYNFGVIIVDKIGNGTGTSFMPLYIFYRRYYKKYF